MIRALLKKQRREVFAWLYQDTKTGARRRGGKLVLFVLLYILLFLYLGAIFFVLASTFCTTLHDLALDWFYWSIMGCVAVLLGVLGSVFSTYASLYRAQDNDLLLSMPIPPLYILIARLSGVYLTGLLYALVVLVPSYLVWLITVPVTLSAVVAPIGYALVLSIATLGITAFLGWIVAHLAAHIRHKTAVTVVCSVLFILLYIVGYSKVYPHMLYILDQLPTLGAAMGHGMQPLYVLGRAGVGHLPSVCIVTAVVLLVTAGICWLLTTSFLHLVNQGGLTNVRTSSSTKPMRKTVANGVANGTTTSGGTASGIANSNTTSGIANGTTTSDTANGNTTSGIANTTTSGANHLLPALPIHSPARALFLRELRRFTSNANYVMNCGLGLLMLVVGTVAVIWKGALLTEMLDGMGGRAYSGLLVLAVAAMAISMNDMTACSLSLEGDTLWLLQSFPLPAKAILGAKVKLQLCLTLPAVVVFDVACACVLRLSFVETVLVLLGTGLYSVYTAVLGLCLDLRMPNLHWTNEIVPIKQGLPVMLVLMGGWVLVMVLGGIYLALSAVLPPLGYMALLCVALAVTDALLLRWLLRQGVQRFEHLS